MTPATGSRCFLTRPNAALELDAAMAFSLHIGRHWRGASNVQRYAQVAE